MDLIGQLPGLLDAPTPKTFYEGTERICAPEETIARVRPMFRAFGITRLADVTGLDRIGLPVVQAIRPMSKSLSVKQGKGRSLAAATASAAMEASEAWHAENIPDNAWQSLPKQTTFTDLKVLGVASSNQESLANGIDWAIGYDMLNGRLSAAPKDLISLDFTQTKQCPDLQKSSNGLASGNTLGEAVASALFEIIERDCIAEFDALPGPQKAARRVTTDALSTYGADDLASRVFEAGAHLECWDMTSDIGVPAFRATIYDTGTLGEPEAQPWISRPQAGFGCHLNPQIAISRAITEAAQSRLVLIAASRDDLFPHHYDPPSGGNIGRLLADAADTALRSTPYEPRANLATKSCETDIAKLLEMLKQADLTQLLLFDLTKAEFGLPVVRAVCPGLGRLIPADRSERGTRSVARNV